jgi:transcriptional regulator with XRE-family HTH domain
MSDRAILKEFGSQIRQMRLNKNITQAQLAANAGLSRRAVSVIENSGAGSMVSIVQILRALEKLEMLNLFSTETLVSPIQIAKLYGKKRLRASRNKNIANKNGSEW